MPAATVALDLIHKGDVYADLTASVTFKNKVDARDDRPMTYPIRLILPPPPLRTSDHACGDDHFY